jgi:flagellin
VYQSAVDPSGLAISTKLRARIRSEQQLERNLNDGISIFQVAEGTLSTMQDLSVRLRELALQSASDTVDPASRKMIDREFGQVKEEMKRLATSSKYNGKNLLNGSGSVYDLQIGVNNNEFQDRLNYNMNKVLNPNANYGLNTANVASRQSAKKALDIFNGMTDELSKGRAELGAMTNRLESAMNNVQISRENNSNANSIIRDTDIAGATARRAGAMIQRDTTVTALQTANLSPQGIAKLFT